MFWGRSADVIHGTMPRTDPDVNQLEYLKSGDVRIGTVQFQNTKVVKFLNEAVTNTCKRNPYVLGSSAAQRVSEKRLKKYICSKCGNTGIACTNSCVDNINALFFQHD